MTSAQRKLARGVEQVQTLCGEATAFESRNAYVLRTEEEAHTAQEVRYRCLVTEIEPPPNHWPLLAGEAIHNLRGALDHSVWAASNRRSSRTQFPIFTDRAEFEERGRPMIRGVPTAIRTFIEEVQPYRVLPDAPQMDALELLRSLSNVDKHRTLNAVVSAVDIEYVGVGEGVAIRWEQYATDRVLEHGETHVSTLVATARPPGQLEHVNVEPGFTYQVRIEGRPLDHLVPTCRRVFEVVRMIETGERPPFAAYPL